MHGVARSIVILCVRSIRWISIFLSFYLSLRYFLAYSFCNSVRSKCHSLTIFHLIYPWNQLWLLLRWVPFCGFLSFSHRWFLFCRSRRWLHTRTDRESFEKRQEMNLRCEIEQNHRLCRWHTIVIDVIRVYEIREEKTKRTETEKKENIPDEVNIVSIFSFFFCLRFRYSFPMNFNSSKALTFFLCLFFGFLCCADASSQ